MKTSDVSLSDRARIHGAPGVSPRIRALLRLMLPVAGFSAAAGWLLCAIRPPPGLPSSLAALLLVLLALGAAVFLVRSRDRLGDYLKGALGEQRTAYELAGLDKDFDVFHGLPLLGGQIADCDHVVVGPAGIFVVETKNWNATITVKEGRILYNGRPPDRPPLRQVRQAADRLRKELRERLHLDLSVQPVLCFVSAALPDGSPTADGVRLCGLSSLRDTVQLSSGKCFEEEFRVRVVEHLHGRSEAG